MGSWIHSPVEVTMRPIKKYEVINHGPQDAQYFQGEGIALTEFDAIATGVGHDAYEAYNDALEGLAQQGWVVDAMPESPYGLDEEFEAGDFEIFVSVRVTDLAIVEG
jgi:hypothetical protein